MECVFYCKKCGFLRSGYDKDLNFFWGHKSQNSDNRCLNKGEYKSNSSSSSDVVFVVMDKIQ